MSQRIDKDAMACNKPRRTPSDPKKSHVVKACYDGKEKIIHFGEQGASTAGKPKQGESERMKAKRKSFKARHAKNIAKGKSSAAYWADKVKWADGGAVSLNSLAAKYDDGGEVSVEDLIARLEAATPLERQTYETLGMEPGLDRAAFLPIAGSRSGGNLQMAMPGFIYDIGKAFMTPGAAARGVPISYDDVVNMAANTMGGGLAISSPVEGAVAGMAIKQKGGNWLTGNIERQTQRMKSRVIGQDPARRLEDLEAAYAQNVEAGVPVDETFMQRERERMMPDIAINRWIDTKLNRYIRNEMGTPEDPVRALAESGALHYQPRQLGPQTREELRNVREMEGLPGAGFGQSELAQRWEGASDLAVYPNRAGYVAKTRDAEANPWLAKVDPETSVYEIGPRDLEFRGLGFDHLIDELKNAIDPESTLPNNLRIDPKDIDKITVPQAVQRVARINDWRAQEAIRAERAGMMANLQATPRIEVPEFALSFTEKPGGRWVDIPETVDEKGLTMCTSIGKAGGWCTQGEGLAKSYGSGDNRLTALVDAEGRPHAQAKISTSRVNVEQTHMGGFLNDEDAIEDQLVMNAATILQERGLGKLFGEDVDTDILAEALMTPNPRGLSQEARDAMNEVYAEAENRLPKTNLPKPDITELKPPGNSFDSERAQALAKRDPQYKAKVTDSVLKFLNSGEWGRVADLGHYGIVDLNNSNSVLAYLDDIYHGSDNEHNVEMIFNAATDAAPMDTPRFMTRNQFRDFLEPFEPMPPEGHAKGGPVRNYAAGGMVRAYNPTMIDAMVSNFNKPGYKAGGAVSTYNPEIVDALVNNIFKGVANG